MGSRDELFDEELNHWLLQCVNGERPETKKQVDTAWCLEHGADVNTRDSDGNTPLHLAADRGDTTIAEILLKYDADVNARGRWDFTPLHAAVSHGEDSLVALLLKFGAGVDTKAGDGETPLQVAVRSGRVSLVNQLLKHGADVNTINSNGDGPLNFAVQRGDTVLVEQLLKHAADVRIRNKHGDTSLHVAVCRGDAAAVEILLKYGADVTATNNTEDTPLHLAARSKEATAVELLLKHNAGLSIRNKRGETPIHDAARSGVASIVDQLLKHGADLKTPNIAGCTSLHIATVYGKAPVIDLMMKSGVDVNMIDGSGDTPLHLAVSCNKAATVEQLLKYDADVSVRNVHGDTPIHEAARSGAASILEQLLENGASVDTEDSEGDTPLHLAVNRGDASIVELLFKYGANMKTNNNSGYTPLHTAVICGKASIIDLMMNSGADINMTDEAGDTPLHLAAACNKTPTVDQLLKHGADVHTTNKRGETPLCLAVRLGGVTLVDQLLKCGASVDTKDSDGNTPLHLAVHRGDASIVSLLLQYRADVSITSKHKETPIRIALRFGNTSLAGLLLKYGAVADLKENNVDTQLNMRAVNQNVSIVEMQLKYNEDVNDESGYSLLHRESANSNTHIADLLINSGDDVNTIDEDGNTSLHLAARYKETAIVDRLLKNGADVNIANKNGETPLHLALGHGDGYLVELLLISGADMNTSDEVGNTPLHQAASHNEILNIELLLKYGADVNTTNNAGDTPLHIATYCNETATADLLLKYGADISIKNERGETPLYWAVHRGDVTLLDQLLQHGVSLDKKDSDGDTPLHLAVHRGDALIVELLLQFGANVNSINKAGNTPLHIAARRKHSDIADLLLRHGADPTLRNMGSDTPLTVARIFNFEGYEEIVSLLETAEKFARDNALSRHDQSLTPFSCPETPNSDLLNNEHPGFKYMKRSGTSGVCGQLYETKLLCLVLIRALNDEKIEHFLLGTNIHGIGDMDDVCLRYQVTDQDRPVVLFLQAKHRENPEKGKLTVEDLRSPFGNFSLRKYFESYLMINDRFQADNEDPMFEGNIGDVKCILIIYTPVKDCLTKKKTERKLSETMHNLINTGPNTEVFQFDYDEDDLNYLTEIAVAEQLKKLGTTLLQLIMSEEDKSDEIMEDKLLARYHVVLGREVLQQCKMQQENKLHRIWKFRPEFFESKCKYLFALRTTFIREISTMCYDKSRITDEDEENCEIFLQDPCASTISKIIGKLVTYNDKSKLLQLTEISVFNEKLNSNKLKTLQERFNNVVISQSVITEAVRIKLAALDIRLPTAFGNLDMSFHGSEAEVQSKIKALSDNLIHLFKVNYKKKIIDITEDNVGSGKCLEQDIIDINDGIRSAIGNLLAVDRYTNMLKFDLDNKSIPNNAALFLKELVDDTRNPMNEALGSYRIKINIEGFPKESFHGDEFDKQQVRRFLNSLWFYTNQAKEDEVERILKNHINAYYNYEKEANNILFKIHSNAIFLRSHDQILKWWMKKGEATYLSRDNDIFGRAKLSCINNLLFTVIDYMHYYNISCMDFKFNQRIHQNEDSIEVPETFNKVLGKVFDIFDTRNKSISVNTESKKEIVNLLQTADRLARYNVSLNNDRSQSSCGSLRRNEHNDLQNDALPKLKYLKSDSNSGVSGQLYETKLLCLVLIRALNDDQIEPFVLGTNIRGIGDMDDICLRYQVRGQDKPIVLFVQAKHREDCEKGKLTVEDVRSTSGDFSLRKYFESYLTIKERFQTDNQDPMFDGDFGDVDCNLIIYTPVLECFTKKKTDHQVHKKVHYLINTGLNSEVFQYDHDEDDIDYLTEMTAIERLKKFAIAFLELIMSEKDKSDVIFVDKLIARHHMIIGREVLQLCIHTKQDNKEHRIWNFRPGFFESTCKYLEALKSTFIKELSTKRYDKSNITNADREIFEQVLRDPCASNISKIIGKLATFNEKCNQLQILDISAFKRKFEKDEFKTLQEELSKMIIHENVINEAVRIKLNVLEIKLPSAFGNLDMTFRGNEAKIRRRMKTVANKLIYLLESNKGSMIIHINEDIVGPGKSIERGIIDINGGIGSAVGNLLIKDKETTMLKFDLENKQLPANAMMFLSELKDDRYSPINKYLSKYRIKINIDGFPKNSFEGDDYDKEQARDFLNKLWFYTNQAKENEVEYILKNEINKYFNNEISQNRKMSRNISDPVFFVSHDEMQKWWMQVDGSPYLSRASELFERAELADIDNLLQTVINYMYISGIHSIDINIKQRVTDYFKFVQMHQTYNKISGRLFKIFDSEFNDAIDIKLPKEFLNINGKFDFGCDLIFSLEIHPEMEWVALKLLAQVWVVFRRISYSLIAKAGPGSGQRRPKDGFLLRQRFRDRQHYFIDGGKDPLDQDL